MIHRYQLNGYNIVLDVYSGSVHAVDEVAYDAIGMFETHTPEAIVRELTAKYRITEEDAREVLSDIEELKTAGKLFAEASAKAASENAYAARSLRIQGILIIIGIVSSALSAVYFVLRLGEKRSSDEWHVLFGFAPGLRCVAGLSIYFDMTVEMNSPNKLMLQAALISIMIYFLFELRMLLGFKKARPRAYAATGLLATTLTASASVSVIAGYFSGQVANAAFFTEAFFCFNMMVYMMVRTVSFITAAAPAAVQDTANTAEDR